MIFDAIIALSFFNHIITCDDCLINTHERRLGGKLTSLEVADILGVDERTFRRWGGLLISA